MARHRMSRSDIDLYSDYSVHHGRRHHHAGPVDMKHATKTVMLGATSAVAAGVAGFYQGSNNGMPELAGLGYDIWGAIALWLGGIFGAGIIGETAAEYTIAAGTGLAAFAAGSYGAKMGCQSRANNHQTPCGTPQPTSANVDPRFGPFLPTTVPSPQIPPPAGAKVGGWNYRNAYVRRAA